MSQQLANIIDFQEPLSHHFDLINRQWIERMFVVEELDDKVLKDPQKYIIEPGGKIWFSEHPQLGIVGACALLNHGEGYYELTKMGVLEPAQGLKIGEHLLHHVIQYSVESHLPYLFLLTNSKCEAAIHLYEKLGFEHSNEIMQKFGLKYQRCDVAMFYTHPIQQKHRTL